MSTQPANRRRHDCLATRGISARCATCGEYPPDDWLHVPENHHGFYCRAHCPACLPESREAAGGGTTAADGSAGTVVWRGGDRRESERAG